MTQIDALLLSILIEAGVAWPLIGGLGWGSGPRAALAAGVATLLTHWAAWQACQGMMPQTGYASALLLVEAIVIGVETVAYRWIVPLPARRALVASAIVNAGSTTVGLAIYALDLA